MNDLITKIKTLDYKQFALTHGEKIGMGLVVLTVVACLALTNWASEYSGEPRDMEEQADKVGRELKNKGWPEEYQKEFLPYLAAEGELAKVTAPVDLAPLDWGVPMSPKLYARQLPADEPKWVAASDLRSHPGVMPMGVPLLNEEPAEEAKPKKPEKKKKDRDRDNELPGIAVTAPLAIGGETGMMGGAMSAEKARGVRFVCVVGVVDVRQQQNLLASALHVDTLSQAAARLDYKEFQIQRQRAVPGPNPWLEENWKDWSTDSSVEILGQASDFDPEIVAAKYTNQTFTSPLPHRLDGEWDVKIVGHQRIPTLSEEEQEEELIANKAAAKALEEAGDAEAGTVRGGFARVQKDANQMRSKASSAAGSKMGEYMAEMMKSMGGNMEKMKSRGGMSDPRMTGMGMLAGSMMGGGYGGSGVAVDLGAELLLFRYFDFDVEPGECYRYRVKLIVENPSFEESFVSASTVAEGQWRETDWSAPSPPAVVQNDVEYALTRVDKTGKHDGADLKVVQFDTDFGTLIMNTFKVMYGAYVGKEKNAKTLHLDLTVPALKEEDVTFTSRDVLVDSAGATPAKLAASALADLKIEPKEAMNLAKSGKFDMAVTLNRFGELVQLDAGSRGELRAAEDRVEEERKPYKDEVVTSSKKKKDEKAGKSDADIFKNALSNDTTGKKKRGRVGNPLRGGMSMPGPMSMPGMGMPPMGPSNPASRPPRSGARN